MRPPPSQSYSCIKDTYLNAKQPNSTVHHISQPRKFHKPTFPEGRVGYADFLAQEGGDTEMAGAADGEKGIPPKLDLDAKWDACLDITLRRFVYSSLAGASSALLLFRSPTTRWAAIAFGAGVGLGSAYTDCSHIFDGSLPKWPLPPNISSPLSSSSSEDGTH